MKNGILMEVKKGKAILLTKDGSFVSVKLPRGKKLVPGMEYDVSSLYRSKTRRFFLPSLSLSIGALLIFVLFSGVNPLSRNDHTVAAYVSFDVNPSLEAAVNENLQVVQVKAFNPEGENLIHSLQYAKDVSLFQFASSLLNAYDQQGYLSKNPDVLIASTIVDQSDKKMSSSLQDAVTAIKRNAAVYNEKAAIVIKNLDVKKRNAAKKNGVSPGKYLMYLDAKQNHDPLSLKDVKKMSFSELKKKMEKKNDQQHKKNKENMEVPEKIKRNERNIQPEKTNPKKAVKQPSAKTEPVRKTSYKETNKKADPMQSNKKMTVKSAEPAQQENRKVMSQHNQAEFHSFGSVHKHPDKKWKKPPGKGQPTPQPSFRNSPKDQNKMKVKTIPVHKKKMNKDKPGPQKQRFNHEKKWGRGQATPKKEHSGHRHQKKAS
ncbi:anti-sigma factor domain-containing protein [Fictibacillus enclensis]|uniref:anti-sigma factor domain-containing protein n=1 Tax=Fictibacillus enclensis TaxID=1017270 RepID=UPI0025A2BB68|nr:anti-sigma factor domain-containing protein [Fictibacillus enclensis]MDM5339765.1 anti-sigma factor domain-containing protein [Fictibacillus enclensis]